MIIDRLSNLNTGFYPNLLSTADTGAANAGLIRRLQAGFDYLQQTDLEAVEPGTVPIDGDKVFAMHQEYKTKPRAQGLWESHRKYIDIQYVVSGVEQMGFANLEQLTTGEYDAAKDFVPHEGSGSFVLLPAGMFTLFMPTDVHMPGIAVDNPHPVKKVVVKVAVED
jgi:YhcH/YjgK/YiaL family protein